MVKELGERLSVPQVEPDEFDHAALLDACPFLVRAA